MIKVGGTRKKNTAAHMLRNTALIELKAKVQNSQQQK
jgi:hypothetical protein